MHSIRGVLPAVITALTAGFVLPLCGQNWTVARTIAVGEKPEHAAISPDGRRVYVSNSGSGTVSVIDAASGEVVTTVQVGKTPGAILASHDGRSVYVLIQDGLAILDTASLWKIVHIPVPGRTDELALSPDDRRLYMTRVYEGVWYLDIESGELQQAISGTCPIGIAISGNGRRLYVSYQCFGPGGWLAHDALAVYELPSHRRIGVATGLANVGGQLALSPDGAELWAQGQDACSRPDYPHQGCPTVPSRIINVLRASDDLTPVSPIGLSLEDFNGRISFAPDGEAFIGGGVAIKRIRGHNADEVRRIPIANAGDVVFAPGGGTAYAPIGDRNAVDVLIRAEAPAPAAPESASALTLSAVRDILLRVDCADVHNLHGDTLRKLAARLGISGAATLSEGELIGAIIGAQAGRQYSCGSDVGAFALTPRRIAMELSTRGVVPREPGKPVEKLEPGGDPWCFAAERLLSSDLAGVLQILTRKKNEEYREFSGAQQNPAEGSEQFVDITGRLQQGPISAKYLTNAVYLSTIVCPNLVATVLFRQDPEQPVLGIARDTNGKPVTGAMLRILVNRFRRELRDPCSNPLPDAKLLYDMVIPPAIENAIGAVQKPARKLTLVWELSDELRYVPMAALSWDGRNYLAARYDNVVVVDTSAPNAGAELEGFRALAAGDTNQDRRDSLSAIPMVRSELDQVFFPAGESQAPARIPATILLDDGSLPHARQFTSDTFRDALRELHANAGDEKLIVHIASHFILGDTPESSWVLTRSRHLSLADFADKARLPLYGVWLITFSACDTAIGPAGHPRDGREIEGLGYTADRSGAYSVLASLWEVDDESTSRLMKYFYGALQEPRTSKAAALNQAELRFLNGAGGSPGAPARSACAAGHPDPYMHPYYWAPFILIGSWN